MAGMKRGNDDLPSPRAKKARTDASRSQSSDFSGGESTVAETQFTPKSSSSRPKKYFCEYAGCDKAFDRPVRLEAHVRTHTNERPFVCQIQGCDKAFFKSEHLKAHIQNKHSDSADHVCTYETITENGERRQCGKGFTTSSRLKRHVACHEKAEELRCDNCGITFRKMETLQRHIKKEHLNEDAFICSHSLIQTGPDGEELEEPCGQTFPSAGQLRTHETREHSGPRYFCDTCHPPPADGDDIDAAAALLTRPGFKTHAELQTHMKVVHPPTCSHCGKICASNRDLTAHLDIVHSISSSGEKPVFPCTYPGCDRAFAKKGNLTVHIQSVHNKQKKFICGQFDLSGEMNPGGKVEGWNGQGCGKPFGAKASLESHVRTQHLDMPLERKKPDRGKKKREAGKKVKPEGGMMIDSPMQVDSPTSSGVMLSGPGKAAISHLTGAEYAQDRPHACPYATCAQRFYREYDLQQHVDTSHHLDEEHDFINGDHFWLGGGVNLVEEQMRLAFNENAMQSLDLGDVESYYGAVDDDFNVPWNPVDESMDVDPALLAT